MSEPIIINKQMIEQIFDEAATLYDRVGPSTFSQFGQRLVDLVPLVPGMRLLDIATGTGAVLLPAARRVGAQGRVTGIDLSCAILHEAEQAVSANGLTNVELCKMDAEHLDFPDQAFDVVTCALSLFLFPDVDAALSVMYRVCKPGGYVAVSYFNKTPPMFDPAFPILVQQSLAYHVVLQLPQPTGYTPQELEALLSRFGFHSCNMYYENNDIVYASVEDWWAFCMTIVGPRATFLSMNNEIGARFKNEYLAKLRSILRQDGLHISFPIIYVITKR